MITGNKGEWSEVYTLLKILSDRKLYAGDSDLNKVEGLIYPIIKVLRDESSGNFEFGYDDDLIVIKKSNDEDSETFRIPISTFQKQAHLLLSELKSSQGRAFSIPETEYFINSYNSTSIKASSSIKSDIQVVIHDQKIGTNTKLGFSIKSQLGGSSTLLNASGATNFKFEIKDITLSDSQIEQINNIDSKSKIQNRIKQIQELGGRFNFIGTNNKIFSNNLILIDSRLPEIIAYSLQYYYTSSLSKVADLIDQLTHDNPLCYDITEEHPFYSYKFKHFLTDIALGMMPSTVWTGELDATGGYLIVKEDGDILCYHIYNRNDFENYLFYNTRFETPSSTRHGFGTLYKENGHLYFNLNLQIRFL